VKLQFLGHYKEPKKTVALKNLKPGDEKMYHLQYTPETRKWKVDQVSLSFVPLDSDKMLH